MKYLFTRIILYVLLSTLNLLYGEDISRGYELFQQNCTSCHQIDGKLVGPELRNVEKRINKNGLDKTWLYAWIKNNKELRDSGDKYANKIFKEYNNSEMLLFKDFSDADIDDILAYTNNPEEGEKLFNEKKNSKDDNGIEGINNNNVDNNNNNNYILIGFSIILSLLLWILYKLYILSNLNKRKTTNTIFSIDISKLKIYYKKYSFFIMIVISIFIIYSLYGFYWMLMDIGVDKGYKPKQPIYFSHNIHAGVNKIDCQYCHSSAKYGKVSGIPSVNVCMNCHRVIKEYKSDYYEEDFVKSGMFLNKDEVKKFYSSEINKIYDHSGWNPSTNKYDKPQYPIEWIRIHNMQDFVYFNHSQHVVAGEKSIKKAMKNGTIPNYSNLNIGEGDQVCYACHGRVDKMSEVEMSNDFTMGWCIECHKSTEVDMSNKYNNYYFQDLHKKIKNKNNTINVKDIGGLECGKCHY